MPIRITYFVHGTTTDNEKGLASGWADGELSALGKKQVKELGKIIANQKFNAIFCSDLKRAVDSARLAFDTKYKIIQDQRLREINYGDFTQKSDDFKTNSVNYIDQPFPNGESYSDVEKRISDFLKFIRKDYNGKNIALVAHQAPQLALEVILNKKTWEQVIAQDWRNKKAWQPGWEYILN